MPDKPYNLLREQWIPVCDEAGHTWDIAPHEMTQVHQEYGTLPVALAAPRPDFNGALIQFLIGLIQTACPPETERAWRRWFKVPPAPEALRAAFEHFEHAFDLDGDGPRFMQDVDVEHMLSKEPKNMQVMLFDAPSENAIRQNKDHFVKRQADEEKGIGISFSLQMAAMALFTYQFNAPSEKGGADEQHQSTLRNGGPVTTLAWGDKLWETVWLNVVLKSDLEALGEVREHGLSSDIFPWLAPTRTSEKGETTTRSDVHPLQMYWPMPRRIRLAFEKDRSTASRCALNGEDVDVLVDRYHTSPSGTLYKSPWHHPLSPSSGWNALNVTPGQFTYADWTDFATESRTYKPALVIQRLWRKTPKHKGHSFRLWVFGFEMKQANVRAYRERLMPLFFVDQSIRVDFEDFVTQLVSVAAKLAETLRMTLKEALYPQPKRVKRAEKLGSSPTSIVEDASERFWRDTEPHFYRLLHSAQRHLEKYGPDTDLSRLCAYWLAYLRKKNLLRLFDEVTQYGAFRGNDPRAVVQARRKLSQATGS